MAFLKSYETPPIFILLIVYLKLSEKKRFFIKIIKMSSIELLSKKSYNEREFGG